MNPAIGPSGPVPALAPPETPSKSGRRDVNECLHRFAHLFDIDLPINVHISPTALDKANKGSEARVTKYGLLLKIKRVFYQDQDALDRAIVELRSRTPQVREQPDRLQILADRLAQIVSTLPVTPHSTRERAVSPLKSFNDALDIPAEAPTSPTLAVKHAPSVSVLAPVILAADNMQRPPPSRPQRREDDRQTHAKAPQSANTSFATTVATSSMSDTTSASKTSQSTVATSFSGDVGGSPADDLLTSSWPQSQVQRLEDVAKAISARQDHERDQHGRHDSAKAVADDLNARKHHANPPQEARPMQHYKVTNIRKDGLAPLQLPRSCMSLPLDIRLEAVRFMKAHNVSSKQMEEFKDYLQSFSTIHELARKLSSRDLFERSKGTDFSDCTLYASLQFSKAREGPLFGFEPRPPRKEDLNSFQRKFGSDRILVVDCPPFSECPKGLSRAAVEEGFLDMLCEPQAFLGRTWQAFLIQDKKRSKLTNRDSLKPGAYQVHFFAIDGDDIPRISISEFLEWFIPYDLNKDSFAAKIYARLDLGASRTKPTWTFGAGQIKYGRPDKVATRDDDDDPFADPSLPRPDLHRFDPKMVMDDGCCEISIAAMDKVRKMLGLNYIPSVVQARIFGAKGVWYLSNRLLPHDPTPDDVWIAISKSQIKAKHRIYDDAELLTLNVVNWSRPLKPSVLYPGFLPILVDRGVPPEVILNLAREQVRLGTEEFIEALGTSQSLHYWIFQHRDLLDQRQRRSDGFWELGGFPRLHDERCCKMLEAGFVTRLCTFLNTETIEVAKKVFDMKAKKFKIPLPKSTSAIGIADPKGVLKPNEVHIGFSTPFHDPTSGESWSNLDDLEGLVARNPSMRNSDIRKIKLVYKPELAHLHDVIIFSTKGRRPLAGMLSGGDYDGDTFWLTWEHALVEPFRNAPAPWEPRPLEEYGIVKDTVKLVEIEGGNGTGWSDEKARNWIRRSMAARIEFNYLGTVTLTHGSLTYASESISSGKADRLVDVHDYLVDADKQGYYLSQEAWKWLKHELGIPDKCPVPAYRAFTSHDEPEPDKDDFSKSKPQLGNIIDGLYFDVVMKMIKETITRAQTFLGEGLLKDTDLTQLYDGMSGPVADGSVISSELKALRKALQDIQLKWNDLISGYANTGRKPAMWEAAVEECQRLYAAMEPVDKSHPTVVEWLRTRGRSPTVWDELKASALARYHCGRGGTMMFAVAGGVLCYLKAQGVGDVRPIAKPLYLLVRPHKRKKELDEGNEQDGDGAVSEGETYYEGASVLGIDDFGPEVPSKSAAVTPSKKRRSSPEYPDTGKRRQSSAGSPGSMDLKPKRLFAPPRAIPAPKPLPGSNDQVDEGATQGPLSDDWETYLMTGQRRKSAKPKFLDGE